MEPGNLRPPIPPKEVARLNAQRLLFGIKKSEEVAVAAAFWEFLWLRLQIDGWACHRPTEYAFGSATFFPPEGLSQDRARRVHNENYFDTIRGVISYLSKYPAKYTQLMKEFKAEILRRRPKPTDVPKPTDGSKPTDLPKPKRQRRKVVVDKVSELDAWKYKSEREHIKIGRRYQAGNLPLAGTHQPGDEQNYTLEDCSDTLFETDLTPSIWYTWARDPDFAEKFDKVIMESQKQMHLLASTLDRPVGFCLWYYYHKYKSPKNHERYQRIKSLMNELKAQQNSSYVCAICKDVGNLLCCDTCPNSYHKACLGLGPLDLGNDTDIEWSCPACVKKRHLQLSPPKSPNKRRRDESPTHGRASDIQKNLSQAMDIFNSEQGWIPKV